MWPVRVWLLVGSVKLQRRTVLSLLPEARNLLSGLKVTLRTELVWPVRVWLLVGSVKLQRRTVLSPLPEARNLLSGLKVTL